MSPAHDSLLAELQRDFCTHTKVYRSIFYYVVLELSTSLKYIDVVCPIGYSLFMNYEITGTKHFTKWLALLKKKDKRNHTRVMTRLDRVEQGNFGDFKQFDDDIFYLRFFFGTGFRIYYTIKNNNIVLLLNGGDKIKQSQDFIDARKILDAINEE